MIQVTATDFKSNLAKYLALVGREDIHIAKNGTDTAVQSASKPKLNWVDDLIGVIPDDGIDVKQFRAERLMQKYEDID